MEKALWYLLAGTRGGVNRARIISLLDERPQNANQLANELDIDYNTVRYHLDTLIDHDVVEAGGEDYGELYFLSDRFDRNRDAFDRIASQADIDVAVEENGPEEESIDTERGNQMLGGIWARNYRELKTPLTLGLLGVATALIIENLMALSFLFSMDMLYAGSESAQLAVLAMRGLQFVAVLLPTIVSLR